MKTDAYEKVKLARSNMRPTSADYIHRIFDVFLELHGDRKFSDDGAIVGGIAMLGNTPVTVISIEKGHSVKERTMRSFG
ncbi:MAG: acetyl-CoA carboxylase carboxyl transferase subunit alpha, partial [Parasporobacterium sp.]|nr:acetyl-CoA carboxylase carboxyl transferase subunit alpha [Parasporobacterium sp.]